MVTFSGFTDEALAPFGAQVRMAAEAGLTHIELRRIGLRGILAAPERTLALAESALREHGVAVSCIATGLGKTDVTAPMTEQAACLRRAAGLAHRFGTPYVRTFSWHTRTPQRDRDRVLRQFAVFADIAEAEGVTLLHENEKGVYGDVPERCLDLVEASSGRVGLILDPANFVQCGVRPADEAWPALAEHTVYLHAKDALAASGRVVPVGEGDAQWAALASALGASGWDGFVSLEPHLGLGGRGGPITTGRWVQALESARRVLEPAAPSATP